MAGVGSASRPAGKASQGLACRGRRGGGSGEPGGWLSAREGEGSPAVVPGGRTRARLEPGRKIWATPEEGSSDSRRSLVLEQAASCRGGRSLAAGVQAGEAGRLLARDTAAVALP